MKINIIRMIIFLLMCIAAVLISVGIIMIFDKLFN